MTLTTVSIVFLIEEDYEVLSAVQASSLIQKRVLSVLNSINSLLLQRVWGAFCFLFLCISKSKSPMLYNLDFCLPDFCQSAFYKFKFSFTLKFSFQVGFWGFFSKENLLSFFGQLVGWFCLFFSEDISLKGNLPLHRVELCLFCCALYSHLLLYQKVFCSKAFS